MAIKHVSLITVHCTDQQASHDFYVDVLGMEPRADVTMGEGFRWLTAGPKDQPELELTFMTPGPPLDPEFAQAVQRALDKGVMNGVGLTVDDCHASYEELRAKGVEFVQEPSQRPYGTEAVMRDNSGNWLVLVEPKEWSPEDFA
jgi:catechol 2,3-dioxygenase-like lactoylglutathione lyase family enzyme